MAFRVYLRAFEYGQTDEQTKRINKRMNNMFKVLVKNEMQKKLRKHKM